MSGHLTTDEQVDALEHTLAPERAAHLDVCQMCRDDVARLRDTIRAARGVDVPEPSPLFWQHQAARISTMVAAESIERRRSPWTYAGLVGTGVAVLAAGLLLVRTPSAPTPAAGVVAGNPARHATASPADVRTRDAADERAWALVEELGDEFDADAVTVALTPATGATDRALQDLDADEQAELVRVLQGELKGKAG
jgi:hypothetical protein